MKPNGRNDGRRYEPPRLLAGPQGHAKPAPQADDTDVVFDFTGMPQLHLGDLALVLTARLQAAPSDRVWVRALPPHSWVVLRALGLDHMFHRYPSDERPMD